MRRLSSKSHSVRRGAAAVEGALVLSVFLLFLFGLLDLGLAVLRYNTLAECARRAAREAIVRGEFAAVPLQVGPDEWSGSAADAHPLADSVRPLLVSMEADDVLLSVEWPDGGHRVGQRVRITMTYEHESFALWIASHTAWSLEAATTMRIVH